MAKKISVLSKDDVHVLRNARSVLNKISSKIQKLEKARKEADEDPTKGGTKWKRATEELYGLLDDMSSCGIYFDCEGEDHSSICLKVK